MAKCDLMKNDGDADIKQPVNIQIAANFFFSAILAHFKIHKIVFRYSMENDPDEEWQINVG